MWTRLEGTELWEAARDAHAQPAGRRYHVFAHPMRLYEIAEMLGLPYDEDLDKAILFHDAIYTGSADDVRRSAMLLLSLDPAATRAAALIMTTEDHTPCADNRLILLDLHDIPDPVRAPQNKELLVEEFANLKGITRDEFMAGNVDYMSALRERIIEGVSRPDVHRDDLTTFARIVRALPQSMPAYETPSM